MNFKEKWESTPNRGQLISEVVKLGKEEFNIQTIHVNLGERLEPITFFDNQLNEEIYMTLFDLTEYLKTISWPNGIYIFYKNQVPYLKVNIGSVKANHIQMIELSEFESKLEKKRSWFWFW